MRSARLALLVLAATLATPASAQSFLGKWIATATTPDGQGVSEELTASKTKAGYDIAVKAIGERPPGSPEAGPATEIKLEGNSFSYKRGLNFNGNEVAITYTGTVSGDSFTGTAEIGGFTVPYNGVRQELGEPAD